MRRRFALRPQIIHNPRNGTPVNTASKADSRTSGAVSGFSFGTSQFARSSRVSRSELPIAVLPIANCGEKMRRRRQDDFPRLILPVAARQHPLHDRLARFRHHAPAHPIAAFNQCAVQRFILRERLRIRRRPCQTMPSQAAPSAPPNDPPPPPSAPRIVPPPDQP